MTLQQLRYALTIAGCGSMNEAAKRLFLSQPSLSETVKELEQEIGLQIFMRSNRGIIITPEGEEFLGYARQVIDQYGILKARYVEKQRKEKFSVSMQHYTFAVKAFVETVKKAGMDSYEFAASFFIISLSVLNRASCVAVVPLPSGKLINRYFADSSRLLASFNGML